MVLVNGVQLLSSSFFTAIGKALELKCDETDSRNNEVPFYCKKIRLPYAVILPCTIVEADDRLGSLRDSHNNGHWANFFLHTCAPLSMAFPNDPF